MNAKEINPDAPSPAWRIAKQSERLEYAHLASIMCKSRNCGSGQIKACVDEATRPPTPPGMDALTIGEVAIGCIKILNSK